MTQFSEVYSRFFDSITDNMYIEWTEQDTKKDVQNILIASIPGFEFPKISLNYEKMDYDLENFCDDSYFYEDLSQEEINILVNLMLLNWLQRQITSIENKLDMIKNVHVAVAERDNDITLLYKVEDGAMGKSYGINVAKLANLPEELIARSSEILEDLLKEEVKTNSNVMRVVENKLPSWVDELKNLDPLSMSPLQALNYLYELKRKMGDK